MRDLLQLLAVFAGLYLFDCVHWARREAVGFRAWWGRRARVVAGEDMPGNERHGIVVAQPLPPFGRLFLTQIHPVAWTAEAACSFTARATNPGPRAGQVERVVEPREIVGEPAGQQAGQATNRDVPARARVQTEARRVLVDGRTFVDAGSERLARIVAARLAGWARATPRARERALDADLNRALDHEAALARVRAFEDATGLLRWACGIELFVVFVVVPVVGLTWGLALTWPLLLAAFAGAHAFTTWRFARAHRALYPEEHGARRAAVVLLALSPPAALRAVDALSRDLLAEFEPLSVARALLEREAFEAYAEGVMRDLLHPLPMRRDGATPRVRAVEEAWRARVIAAFEHYLTGAGLSRERWRGVPRDLDADAAAYCPRCRQSALVAGGGCARCWDMPLVASARS